MNTPTLLIITVLCSAFLTHIAHIRYTDTSTKIPACTQQLSHIDSMLESINTTLLNMNIQSDTGTTIIPGNNTPLKQLIADVVTETVKTLPSNTTTQTANDTSSKYLPEPEQQARFDSAQIWIDSQVASGTFTLSALGDSHVVDGLPPEKIQKLISGVMRRIHNGELDGKQIIQ